MPKLLFALTALVAMSGPAYAQTDIDGTFRVDGAAPGFPFPWSVVLRADGTELRGRVRTCSSNFNAPITDGRVNGTEITFACTNLAGTRRLTFTGSIDGDILTLTWSKQLQPGEPATSSDDALFGDAAPRRFAARRIRDQAAFNDAENVLIGWVDRVHGAEFVSGVNLRERDVKIDGVLFIPQQVARIRAVIVAPAWGIGADFYADESVKRLAAATGTALLRATMSHIQTTGMGIVSQNAALGGAEALLLLLRRLGQESGRAELGDIPVIFWGHSSAGPFGTSFAGLHPERTVAFVRYHSGPFVGADLTRVASIPGLFFVGGKDQQLCPDGTRECAQRLWATGRAAGAPWTFALEPEAVHGNVADAVRANRLLEPWLNAVLDRRVPPAGGPLRPVTAEAGTANWLPDEASARAWQAVTQETIAPR
jgi:hypothetical protein